MTERPAYELLAVKLSQTIGLLALGVALGSHLSLMEVQAAVMTTHVVPLKAQVSSDVYRSLLTLQSWSNTSGYLAAVLLVASGVLARRPSIQRHFVGGDEDA